jgi:carboxypeptidase family protein
MQTKRLLSLIPAAIFVLLVAAPVFAQVTTAKVRGVVTDPSGAVLPGVRITAKNVGTGVERTATTDGSGAFEIASLPPGRYELGAELAGFKRFVRGGVELSVGQEASLPIGMQLGEVTEQVEVEAAAPLVDTQNAAVSGLVEGNTVREMPLNGRSFDQLALLNPGVSAYYSGGQNLQNGPGLKMSVSGGRPESTYFMLDGTNVLDHSNFTPGSAAGNNLGVDAIQEFRVFAHNYSAGIGVRGAGAVSIVSRSGGNQLHGSGYEFYRNSTMDARNFFDQASPPPFNRNQYGGSLGGAIRHDKTFFFSNVEHMRERLGQSQIGFVPNAETRQGRIPGSAPITVSPLIKPYLNLFPLPNGPDLGDGTAEYLWTYQQPTDETFLMGRIDHRFSEKDSIFGRYTFDDATVVPTGDPIPGWLETQMTRSQFFTLQETHIFRSNVLNEFRAAFNRTNPHDDSTAVPPLDPALKFFPSAREMGAISFSAGRGTSTGGALSQIGPRAEPRKFTQNIWEYTDNVSHWTGRHSIRAGVDFQRIQFNGQLLESPFGTFGFTGLSNLLLASPTSVDVQKPGSNGAPGFRQSLVGMFVQDDFRLRSNLTLNLGFRYEFTTVPTEVHGHIANLINPLDPAPVPGRLLSSNNSLRDFGPRFGVAWDPSGDGKTSVRAGAGIFFSQVMGRNYYVYALHQSFWDYLTSVANPPFPNPFANGLAALPTENDRIDPNLKTPTIYQYSLTIERQFLGNFSFEAGYIGSHGSHLLRNYEGNTAFPTAFIGGRPFYGPTAKKRNLVFSSMFSLASDANSSYNSMQLSLKKRASHGLQFQVNYTFSKSIDNASNLQAGQGSNNPAFTQDVTNPSSDRGPSGFNIPHTFSFNFAYDLPKFQSLPAAGKAMVNGWQLGGIVRASSGPSMTVQSGFNRSNNQSTTFADRPNLNPGANNNPVLGKATRWFDPSAFSLPPAGFYGNLGRNTMNAPSLAVFDLSVVRRFPIKKKEGTGFEFRGEIFNVLNHTNLGLPNLRVFNSSGQVLGTAGVITTTVTRARQIQLGLKFTF